jgi:hypothetical protein
VGLARQEDSIRSMIESKDIDGLSTLLSGKWLYWAGNHAVTFIAELSCRSSVSPS